MAIPQVEKFFNIFPLETGSVSICILYIAIALGNLVYCAIQSNDCDDDDEHSTCIQIYIGTETGMALSVTGILASFCLLFGIIKRNPIALLVWLIFDAIAVYIAIIFAFILCSYVEWSEAFLIIFLCLAFILLSLFVYMWIVVYSHYVVLKEENARGQYDKQPYRAT